jgi:ankyrin repeat protein
LWTPLHYACACGNQASIEFLINHGADPSITDATGRTAQQIAVFLKRNCKVPIKTETTNSKVDSTSDFSEFIKNPSKYLFDGNMDHVEESE